MAHKPTEIRKTHEPSEPYFQLFRSSPLQGRSVAYLASALQAFETTLFMLGLSRFPGALIMCAGAIESAIKSIPESEFNSTSDGLRVAVEYVKERKPKLRQYNLNEFIGKRNEFLHRGYSPAHDGESVGLILAKGLPFLAACLWEFHKISLRDNVIQCIWQHIEFATTVLTDMQQSAKAGSVPPLNWQIGAVKALRHLMKHGFLPDFNRRWTDTDFGLPCYEFEAKQSVMNELQSKWEPSVYINCPIPSCNSAECLVGLNDDLSGSRINASKLFCFECSFSLTQHDLILMQRLISKGLAEKRPEVLREYGLP